MSFTISENDIPMDFTIPQFIESFEKIDNYVSEKQKVLQDLDIKILIEQRKYIQIYQEYLESESLLKKLQKEEDILNYEIKKNEEKENMKKVFYNKMMECNFDNKMRLVENEKPYPEDKYFTVEWTIPLKRDEYPQYHNGYLLYIMFDIETKRIVKMNDSKGKILDKENIDWNMFDLNDKKNRNALLLEIYKEYGSDSY